MIAKKDYILLLKRYVTMRIRLKGEMLIAVSMFLLIFYLCIPISMVFLNSILIYLIVFFAGGFFVAGLVILKKRKYLISHLIIFIFMFFFWRITWSVQLDSVSYVCYCFVSLCFVFGGMILYTSENKALIRGLFLYLTMIYFITAVTSIIGLNVYPLAARELARGSTYDTSLDFTIYKNIYRRMNIASWSQIYGMMFAIPVSLMIWKRKGKPLYIVFCIALILSMIASQITFAVLLSMVLAVAVYISRKKSRKTIILSLALLITAAILLMNLEYFLTYTVELSKEAGLDFLTTKLNDMKILLLYRNAVGDASGRGALYQTSLDTFFRNPVFGLLIEGKATHDQIGFHSEFFDLLGTLGIMGLIVIITSLMGYYGFLRRIEKDIRRDLIIIFIGFIGLFVFNPVFNSPQIFAGAFLYPLLASKSYFHEEKERDKRKRGMY